MFGFVLAFALATVLTGPAAQNPDADAASSGPSFGASPSWCEPGVACAVRRVAKGEARVEAAAPEFDGEGLPARIWQPLPCTRVGARMVC